MRSVNVGVTEEQMYAMFVRLDWDRDGVVSRGEFVREVGGGGMAE